jgi:hypothetical protein
MATYLTSAPSKHGVVHAIALTDDGWRAACHVWVDAPAPDAPDWEAYLAAPGVGRPCKQCPGGIEQAAREADDERHHAAWLARRRLDPALMARAHTEPVYVTAETFNSWGTTVRHAVDLSRDTFRIERFYDESLVWEPMCGRGATQLTDPVQDWDTFVDTPKVYVRDPDPCTRCLDAVWVWEQERAELLGDVR